MRRAAARWRRPRARSPKRPSARVGEGGFGVLASRAALLAAFQSWRRGRRSGRSRATSARFRRGRAHRDRTAERTLAGMRPACLAALALVLMAPVACDPASSKPKHDPLHTYEGRVIRGWLLALERQDYEQAAYYFAPGAIIDQGRPFRLKTANQARNFNASLPCRAELIALRDEGRRVLATFQLHEGPGGGCSGLVKVHYTIREGKFTEWRQLPNIRNGPAPSQSSASLSGGCPAAAAPRVRAASHHSSPPRSAESRSACPRHRGRPS